MEFKGWAKTTRLYSDITITEKIDGGNSAVVIERKPNDLTEDKTILAWCTNEKGSFVIGAQSRNRLLDLHNDNQGFAAWVAKNSGLLVNILGEGTHFGEWTRKGLREPKLFLFNTYRWKHLSSMGLSFIMGLDVVPVLYEGRYTNTIVQECLTKLETDGSLAYDAPAEGVCVYWHGDQTIKKAFCKHTPKGKGNI